MTKIAVCVALAAAAACLPTLAAPSVEIANVPLPVTGSVNARVTNTAANPIPVATKAPSVTPYQSSQSIGCNGQLCRAQFPVVPAGKRLVVESVSAGIPLGMGTKALMFENGNGNFIYFVAMPPTDASAFTYVHTAVKIYYEAGEAPTARPTTIYDAPPGVRVTIVGTLVPAD